VGQEERDEESGGGCVMTSLELSHARCQVTTQANIIICTHHVHKLMQMADEWTLGTDSGWRCQALQVVGDG
jgi:hypothetical protein